MKDIFGGEYGIYVASERKELERPFLKGRCQTNQQQLFLSLRRFFILNYNYLSYNYTTNMYNYLE
jgi:hypothetical protein